MLSDLIKSRALELGFAKVGIVPAEALTEEAARLREWLDRGYHGEMAWMAREPEKRTDPRIFFPGAKTVVVVLMNYFTETSLESLESLERGGQAKAGDERDSAIQNPQSEIEGAGASRPSESANGSQGQLNSEFPIPKSAIRNPKSEIQHQVHISKYAHGDDYHDVVGERLRDLLAYVKELVPGADGKTCVDIQPMMDKAWAARAGLGWIGKHTNLITRELGSWVFIGELVLDIELEYDSIEEKDRCGTCTACIDACPTGAITEPYVVDSNRCISYATIELRAPELPEQISDNLEGWLYGCDICQDVCPWNRFEQPTGEPRFEAREFNVDPDLDEIISLTQEEFSARYKGSAMKRTKLSGLVRNAKALKDRRS